MTVTTPDRPSALNASGQTDLLEDVQQLSPTPEASPCRRPPGDQPGDERG